MASVSILVPYLQNVKTRPSGSDHSVITISLQTSTPRGELGPGTWHLHREAHLQPGFELCMSQFTEQLQKEASRPPIKAWYAFVERVRTTSSNVATTLSQQACKRDLQCNATVQELASIDIRHGDQNQARFLELLTFLRQMDITYIIPRFESRTFAALPSLRDSHSTHDGLEEKPLAIQLFYTALFTPKERDSLTEEAGSILISSIQSRISSATFHACEAPFTVEELHSVLTRSQEMSAPGLDGISYPLFRILGTTALEKLCALGNALLYGHHLPNGEPMLRGVLLPKKGDLSLLNSIINPFLFLGRRNWIRHAYVVTPRHLGGLGVIDTNTMSIVLIGQMAANLLQSKEPIGSQFRAVLQEYLWTEYKALPAHFILRRGMPWLAMTNILVSQRSFLSRVVYALSRLRLTITPDWNSITVQELLTLLFYNDMFGYTWLAIHEANTQYWERNGLRVWGDLLWYNPNERGKVEHPYVCANTYPLVPPSPAGCKNNYVASRDHPDTYECFSSAAGQLLPRHWIDMWAKLHPTVRSKLLDISKTFALHPDHSKSKKNPRPHDRPFNIDTVGLPFPKHLTTFAEKPLSAYTVKHARSFLSPNEVVVPQWSFESTSDQWRRVWEWHNNDSLLSSEASSDVFLFLHSSPWLAQKPRGDRQLTNYNILNEDTIALRILMHQDHGNPDEALEAINDTYEEEHVFGVSSCMLCSGPEDSTIHSFIKCDLVQQHIWKPLLGTLRRLCGGRGVPTDARNIVGLQNDHRPQLTLINFMSDHAALVAKTITNAYYKQPQPKRPVFSWKWIVGRTFLQVVNDTIRFHLMALISIRPLNLLLPLSSPLYLLTIGLLTRGHDLLLWPTTLLPKHREVTSLWGPTVDSLCTL
ncbi:uncharacterized protein UDID_17949 [Ustilago sp. UG-2017a]|nr:uncharacterized protein UDID_17949 [Ustilago sp. UG-2017a]